jgi:hypothetical protein
MSGNQIKRPLQNLTIVDYNFKSVIESSLIRVPL